MRWQSKHAYHQIIVRALLQIHLSVAIIAISGTGKSQAVLVF